MKIRHVVAVATVFLLSACGSNPESVAVDFSKSLGKGDTAAALELMDPSVKQMGGPKLAAAMNEFGRKAQTKGGMKGVKVVESSVDGDYAKIIVEDEFKNGTTTRDTIKLHKVDGTWLVTI